MNVFILIGMGYYAAQTCFDDIFSTSDKWIYKNVTNESFIQDRFLKQNKQTVYTLWLPVSNYYLLNKRILLKGKKGHSYLIS